MCDVAQKVVPALLVAALAIVGCQKEDEVGPTPSRGGGTNPPGGSAPGGGSGGDAASDAGSTGDVAEADADASFDLDACRQQFVDNAVANTAWYDLQCQQPRRAPDGGDRQGCQSGSPATERFLQFDDDGTYWFNVIHYDSFDNKESWSGGYCRDPAIRDGELNWELIGCNRIRLTTGCNTDSPETARLTEEGLIVESFHGTVEMTAERPAELRAGRTRNPLGPSGCFDDRPEGEPMCVGN